MGIFSDFLWTLAGGTYAVGKCAQENVRSSGHIDYSHDERWYDQHWPELDHKRQRELYALYKENFLEFVAIGSYVGERWMYGRDNARTRASSGGQYGGYYTSVARAVAKEEGWLYDEDPKLNPDITREWDKYGYYKKQTKQEQERNEVDHGVWEAGIPWIGENNNWWINGEDTKVPAIPTNLPLVDKDNKWKFGNVKTGHSASERICRPSTKGAPRIFDKAGRWYLAVHDSELIDMGVRAERNDVSPTLKDDGYYWCGGVRTLVKTLPRKYDYYYSKNGYWACHIFLSLDQPYTDEYGDTHDEKPICHYEVNTGIPITIRRRFHINPERESEIYAIYDIAKLGVEPAKEDLSSLSVGEIDFTDEKSFRETAMLGNNSIPFNEGWIPLCYGDLVGEDNICNDRALLLEYARPAKEKVVSRYRNYDRQTELWRMLYYAKKGSKEAKLDYYRLTDECYEETIEAYGDGFYLDDIEFDEDSFGKNGCALEALKAIAKSEGWLWDDSYPSPAKQKQIEYDFEREKSYSDPTPLPWNHERQESIYRDRFYATELKDKAAQKSLLLFTGTKDSARLSEEKFFKLCAECAREEGWAWDFDYFTPAKCREIIRECAMEE